MPTRTARYAAYRKRIQSEELFIKNIQHLNEQAEQYKQQINAINPNILMDIDSRKKDVKIYPFAKQNEFDAKDFIKVKEFANKINQEKKNSNINQIQNFLAEYSQSNVIDSNGYVSENWMKDLKNYTDLARIDDESNKCQAKLVSFQTNSEKLLSKVQTTVNDGESFMQIKNLSVDKFTETERSSKPKFLYFGILISLLACIVFAIVLCVLGVALK